MKYRYRAGINKVVFVLILFIIISACNIEPAPNEPVLADEYYTDIFSWNDDFGLDATFLGRAINLGNYLEAPREGDADGEGIWTGGRKITQEDIQRIAAAGFATVRIPCKWTDYLDTNAPYHLLLTGDSNYDRVARVKEILSWVQAAGLKAVLNVHHYTEMMDQTLSSLDEDEHIARLIALWDQLCEEFPLSEYPADELVFELLNEPNGDIDYDDWNGIIADLTDEIWNNNDTTQVNGSIKRKIMIGTANWGGVTGLQNLSLPAACDNSNTIITVHYYEPFHFTHQGASWVTGSDDWIGTRWLGTDDDQAPLLDLFNSIESWNTGEFEIFVGEFGVYSEYSYQADQKAWTAFICRESERRDFSWGYWEYASGFGAWDPVLGEWKEQLITALIPSDL